MKLLSDETITSMNINIKTSNIDLTPAIDAYVRTKVEAFGKLLDISNSQVFIYVELEKTRPNEHHDDDLYRAEITVDNVGEVIYADAAASDVYAALDVVKDEILRKINRTRSKKRDIFRRGMTKIKSMLRLSK